MNADKIFVLRSALICVHRRPTPFERLTRAARIGACLAMVALAQNPSVFKTRLSPVAMDATMRATIAGTGSVTARLTGSKLAVNGAFEGLRSPATVAQVRLSPVTGVRGSAVFDLTITKKAGGAISGSLDLTPEQIESLRKGRLYVQVDSEKAPDGNLWGWLLP